MRVYKFLNAQYALDSILSGYIKLSTVDELNDPFEFKGVNFIKAKIENNDPLINILKKFGLLCVSKKFSNPTLWSHYADSHRGIALGFDISKNIEKNSKINVQYRKKVIKIHEKLNVLTKNEKPALKILSIKSKDWCYENEVRFLFYLQNCIPKAINGDLKFFLNLKENEIYLSEIILGFNCNINIDVKLKMALKNRGITLYRAELDKKLFKVNRCIIP
jgi:hypothetical protein